MRPLVSILIPCFNAAKYVGEAIDSALAQTYAPVEVVCIDDGSTDGTAGVLRSYGDRITFELAPHRGACAARNRALALSRGEFIQFLDADDLLVSTKIAKQLPFLLSGEADLVLSGAEIFEDGRDVSQQPFYPPLDADPFVYLLSHPFQTACPLHRRSFLEAVGAFRHDLLRAQEWNLHLRLAAVGAKVRVVNERLARCRTHDGPRITQTPLPPEYMLQIIIQLAQELDAGELLQGERRTAIAERIVKFSLGALRKGARDSARAGIKYARTLSASIRHPQPRVGRPLSALLGIVQAEHLISLARRLVHLTHSRPVFEDTALSGPRDP